ncbi:hypothetical protein SAMN04488134_1012 [Amphibacillus marinus]|uniref:DUF4044 domain-containing protein n=1 Tax=Amphibacillus marinus TaxID=872970 RepID=A0A1H8G9I7_9BACI|nr:DUF4044 domain-containing protein [Amphibacillus marinus]SEN40425.1 hypothetical protein SAMN04488134_1012 [Amphibacillus marinus]
MAKTKKKQHQQTGPQRPSKREKRHKMIIYIMIIIMVGSVITGGLAAIL